MKNIELRGRRAQLIKDADAIVAGAHAESRSMTGEEKTKFEAIEADARGLKQEIEIIERNAEMKKEIASMEGEARAAAPKANASAAFSKYLSLPMHPNQGIPRIGCLLFFFSSWLHKGGNKQFHTLLNDAHILIKQVGNVISAKIEGLLLCSCTVFHSRPYQIDGVVDAYVFSYLFKLLQSNAAGIAKQS